MDTKNIKIGFDSFLDDKASLLNRNHKIGICLAAILIPAIAFYFISYSPNSKKIVGLQGTVSSLEQELSRVKIEAAKLEQQKNIMREMELKFKEASIVIPDNKEIPNLLTSISNQGTGAGLDILSFRPGKETPKEFYATIPVILSVSGTYHNLGHFLDTVSKLPRIVNVASVKLGGARKVEGETLLQANLNLETYKFIEPNLDAKK